MKKTAPGTPNLPKSVVKKSLTTAGTPAQPAASSGSVEETPFLLYGSDDDKIRVRVRLQGETIWLTQRQIADVFDTTTDNISLHLRNIHTEGELGHASTTEDFSVVQNEGGRAVRRALRHHNLDAIIVVGYRVNSHRATRFRIWATGVLRETIVKGFVLDDERLKQGRQVFGEDYFRELLERVRSIRASERRIWQQVTDIFAECSIDYDPRAGLTQEFFATVQNKFHFAIAGQTAAEIIHTKVGRGAPHIGCRPGRTRPRGASCLRM